MGVAINGLGRIGRAALKIILDTPELERQSSCFPSSSARNTRPGDETPLYGGNVGSLASVLFRYSCRGKPWFRFFHLAAILPVGCE
jgi:hypothetical protein